MRIICNTITSNYKKGLKAKFDGSFWKSIPTSVLLLTDQTQVKLFGTVISKNAFAESREKYTLTKEQSQFYDNNGYLVINELIDFTSLYSYRQRFSQICNRVVDKGCIEVVKEYPLIDTGAKGEGLVNKLQEISFDDVFSTYTDNPRLLHVISQFVGDNITAVHSMLLNKPPGISRHPPHQDLYYFPLRPAHKIVAAWTAIDDVRLDNGCLYVVPGSHKKDKLYTHGNVKDINELYHGILEEDAVAPANSRVYLEMSPGDTVFFHPLLVHGSGPNVTKSYRKAISCHYASSECQYVELANTETVVRQTKEKCQKRGMDLNYTDFFRYKMKRVKGVKCNL